MANPTISDVPDLLKLWDSERNDNIGHDPSKITTGTRTKSWFRCGNGYPHSFLARPSDIINLGRVCGVCAGKQVCRGFNDFESQCPYESYFWDYTKNSIQPWKVAKGSNKSYWFLCEEAHPFSMKPNSIYFGSSWCPYCSGRSVWRGVSDFESQCPYESYFWDYTKNQCNPWEVSKSNGKKFWFVCEEGHSFGSRLYNISIQRSWCPYCAGKLVIPGVNDLLTTYPDIASQLDPSYGYDPSVIATYSNKKVHWQCRSNPDHLWSAYVYNRTGKGVGCPHCSPQRSKAEISMFEWVSSELVPQLEVIPNDTTVLGGKHIDIYIPSLKLGFEYNGNYWHPDKGDPDGPSAQKEKMAAEKGVTLFTIWEDDWTSDRSTWEEFIVRTINLTRT